jgi:hypothetical protein
VLQLEGSSFCFLIKTNITGGYVASKYCIGFECQKLKKGGKGLGQQPASINFNDHSIFSPTFKMM